MHRELHVSRPEPGHWLIGRLFWILFAALAIAALVYAGAEVVSSLADSLSPLGELTTGGAS